MSYFPDRRAGIDPPGVADALSESLSNEYGAWLSWYGDEVRLDAHAAVGNTAVTAYSASGAVIEQGSLIFELANPVDLSKFEKFQLMIAAQVGANDNLTGNGRIILFSGADWANGYASAPFQFAKGRTTDPVAYATKTFLQSDFVPDSLFPVVWNHITKIVILFDTQNRLPSTWDGYIVYIDGGPFFLISSSPPKLAVLAEDAKGNRITFGKHMQLISPTGATSAENVPWGPFGVSPSGNWTITILDEDFVNWKDGSTDRTRTVMLTIEQTVTLTAIFESGETGGGTAGSPVFLVGAGLGLIALIVGVEYYRKKRRRRR